jgi:hypothetical protein
VHLKINVVQPYTGNIAPNYTLKLGQNGYWVVNADKTTKRTNFIINLRKAGERIVTPDGVTGAQTGDANLKDLADGVWLPSQLNTFLGNGDGPVDISGEPDNVRPIVVVEALTEQKF